MTDSLEAGRSKRSRLAAWLWPKRGPDDIPKAAAAIDSKGQDLKDELREGLRLLNAEATRRLDGQQTLATQLDTKAAALVTLCLTGAGLFITQGRSLFGGIAVAGFVIAIGFGIACLGIRTFKDAPQPKVGPEFEHVAEVVTLDRLVRAKANAFEHNRATMDAKADWIKIMTWWMAIPLIAAIVSFYM